MNTTFTRTLVLLAITGSALGMLKKIHKDKAGETQTAVLLAYLQSHGEAHKKVSSLLKQGANPNAKDGTGYTCLHYAAMRGDRLLCESLREYGADIMILGTKGETALSLAFAGGHSGIISSFLNALNLSEQKELLLQALEGGLPVVRLLIKY